MDESETDPIERYRLLTEWRNDLIVHKPRHTNGTEQTWRRQRFLGHGGFGTVWLQVRQDEPNQNEKRAVKAVEIPTQSPTQPSTRVNRKPKYERELLAWVKLSKPEFQKRFVEFYGWFQDGTSTHYAMEFFFLGDLDQYLMSGIPEDSASQITYQILAGLAIMHKNCVIHRDLKPKNIFVVSEKPWHVKIGDFGISKYIDDTTGPHTDVFTPGYAAPEMEGSDFGIRRNSEYTDAVDLWSLGCVVHKMLTGKVPFPTRDQLWDFRRNPTSFPTDLIRTKVVRTPAIEFVQALIQWDPSHRLDAQAALKSPWIPFTNPQGLEEILRNESPLSSQVAREPLVDKENSILTPLGRTALAQFLKAAESGNNHAIWILRDRGIDVNAQSANGRTALHEASFHGQNSTMELLLKIQGINKDIRDNNGNTPLLVAAWAGRFTSLNILLQRGANPRAINNAGACALHATAKLSEFDCTRTLLQKGVPASLAENISKMTPLHYAAAHGSVETMKILVEYDADLNLQDSTGWTALHYTARSNRKDCAHYLLQENASLYPQDRTCDYTPLSVALLWDSTEVTNIFFEHLASLNVKEQTMLVEFRDAVRHNHVNMARRLIQSGFNVNSAEKPGGITPLRLAIQDGSMEFIEMLLEIGASLTEMRVIAATVRKEPLTRGYDKYDVLISKLRRKSGLLSFLQDLDNLAKLGERVSSVNKDNRGSGDLAGRFIDLIEKLTRIICAWNSDMHKIAVRDFERLGFSEHIVRVQSGQGQTCIMFSMMQRASCACLLNRVSGNLKMDSRYYSNDKNALSALLSRSRNMSACKSVETQIRSLRILYATLWTRKFATKTNPVFWGEIDPAGGQAEATNISKSIALGPPRDPFL